MLHFHLDNIDPKPLYLSDHLVEDVPLTKEPVIETAIVKKKQSRVRSKTTMAHKKHPQLKRGQHVHEM